MMWSNLSCNINDQLLLKVQMKSECFTSRSNSFKMCSSCTWIFKNERVPKWSLFDLNIVAVLTYQVKMTWNQKSPTNLKIRGHLHHVLRGGGQLSWKYFDRHIRWKWFWYHSKEKVWADVLNTHNATIRLKKNFLRRFQKNVWTFLKSKWALRLS